MGGSALRKRVERFVHSQRNQFRSSSPFELFFIIFSNIPPMSTKHPQLSVLIRLLLYAAQTEFPNHRRPKSPKKFTQPQLAAMVRLHDLANALKGVSRIDRAVIETEENWRIMESARQALAPYQPLTYRAIQRLLKTSV